MSPHVQLSHKRLVNALCFIEMILLLTETTTLDQTKQKENAFKNMQLLSPLHTREIYSYALESTLFLLHGFCLLQVCLFLEEKINFLSVQKVVDE